MNVGVGVQLCCRSLGIQEAVVVIVAIDFVALVVDQRGIALDNRSSNASIIDVLPGVSKLVD